MAVKEDEFIDSRKQLNSRFEKELVHQASGDIVQEVIGDVKTPPAQPNALQMDIAKHFETTNEHLSLKFTERNYQAFVDLYNLVVRRLEKQEVQPDQPPQEPVEPYTGDVEYIEELITRIQNPMTYEALNNKYIELYYASKRTPVDRASSYNIFKAMV